MNESDPKSTRLPTLIKNVVVRQPKPPAKTPHFRGPLVGHRGHIVPLQFYPATGRLFIR